MKTSLGLRINNFWRICSRNTGEVMSTITIQKVGAATPGVLTGDLSQDVVSGTTTPNASVSIYFIDEKQNKSLLGTVTSNANGGFIFPLTAQNLALIVSSTANGASFPIVESLSASVTDGTGTTTSSPVHFLSLPNAHALGSNGLSIQNISIGAGSVATAGELVVVDYTGYLPDGTVFDSSVSRNQPFAFVLGAGQVIRGWDQGVAGMQVGGERLLDIPASLGYGANTVGSIPANSTLVFDVKLLQAFNPVPAVVNWEALHGQTITASDAAVLLFGGVYSGDGKTYQSLSRQFGNSLDLSAQPNTGMGFALSSGSFDLKGSKTAITFLFGGAGTGTLDGSASIAPKFLFAGTGNTTLLGGSSDDFIQAGDGTDIIAAGLGNNIIVSGRGTATVNGGAGSNFVYYRGSPDQYTISRSGDALSISPNAGNPYKVGIDTLTNISDLIFTATDAATGSTSSIDITQHLTSALDKSIYLIYQAAFARMPDHAGFLFWADQADNKGLSEQAIASSFVASPEFTAKYGTNPTNADFVKALYTNVLGRAPDQAGLKFWIDQADSGLSHQDILINFAHSPENLSITSAHTTLGLWTTL